MRGSLMLLALLAVFPGGADVSGKRSGTGKARLKNGTPIAGILFLVLQQQEGGQITSSAGSDEESAKPFRNGRIDGSKILVEMTDPRNGAVTYFDFGLVDQDRLEGESKAAVAGERRRMALSMCRIKTSVHKPPSP